MSYPLEKYFHENVDNKSEFNKSATDEQIAIVERQLRIELPTSYKDFLKSINGFDGAINELAVNFSAVDKIYKDTQDRCAEYFPWAIYIGTNGNLEMFVIDTRQMPYQFGLLPYIGDDNDFIPLGNTFEKFIERLYNDTPFT